MATKKGKTTYYFFHPLYFVIWIWNPRSGIRNVKKYGSGINIPARNSVKEKKLLIDFSYQACQKESQRMMPVLYGTGRKTQVIPAIFMTVRAKKKLKNFIPQVQIFQMEIYKVLLQNTTFRIFVAKY
jgi:hypothetical protein